MHVIFFFLVFLFRGWFYRWDRVVSAVVSEESAVGSSSFGTDVFKLTYLEVGFLFINSVNLDLFLVVQNFRWASSRSSMATTWEWVKLSKLQLAHVTLSIMPASSIPNHWYLIYVPSDVLCYFVMIEFTYKVVATMSWHYVFQVSRHFSTGPIDSLLWTSLCIQQKFSREGARWHCYYPSHQATSSKFYFGFWTRRCSATS